MCQVVFVHVQTMFNTYGVNVFIIYMYMYIKHSMVNVFYEVVMYYLFLDIDYFGIYTVYIS